MIEKAPEPGNAEILDKPQEACGFVAIVSNDVNAGELGCVAISVLDNRGKEATGVGVIADGGSTFVAKGFGTGKQVFPDGGHQVFAARQANKSMAHARYGTQGTSTLEGAQPFDVKVSDKNKSCELMLVHNGNLTNVEELAANHGFLDSEYTTDSQLMSLVFARGIEQWFIDYPDTEPDLVEITHSTLPQFEGSFSGAIMTADVTIAFTDHHLLKPAVIGRLSGGGTIVASEVTATDKIGAELVREMTPGELVIIENDGSWRAEQWAEPDPKGCILELFYFMKLAGELGTKATFHGLDIEEARINSGRALAEAMPVNADIVFGVPNSGVPHGRGYAANSGIPYAEKALTANSDNRSFIDSTTAKRKQTVREKLNPNPAVLNDQIGIAVEDSLIRGTTMQETVGILRESGLSEVHVRVALAMYKFTCELGVDTGTPDQLIAANMSLESIRQHIDADTLAFLSVKDIRKMVLGEKAGEFCMGCLEGIYPDKQATPVNLSKKEKVVLAAS